MLPNGCSSCNLMFSTVPLKNHRRRCCLITQLKSVLVWYSQEDKNTFPLGFYNIEQEIKLEIGTRVMSGTGLSLPFSFLGCVCSLCVFVCSCIETRKRMQPREDRKKHHTSKVPTVSFLWLSECKPGCTWFPSIEHLLKSRQIILFALSFLSIFTFFLYSKTLSNP